MAGGVSHDPPCPSCEPHRLHVHFACECGCTDGWPTEDSDGSLVVREA